MLERNKKAEVLIAEYSADVRKGNAELFHNYLIDSGKPTMYLTIGPIEDGGIENRLARIIANKYSVEFNLHDFSHTNIPDYGMVFSIKAPDDENEFKNTIEKLLDARKEFSDGLERLVKLALR